MANPRENEDRVTRTADIGVDAQNHGVLRLGRPKADVVAELVAAHREKDPQLRAYWNPNGPPDEIQLVEVTPEVADTDEVLAFRFGATPDFEYQYAMRLVLVSPGEWDRLLSGKLKLPAGWAAPSDLHPVQ